jgi:hypothetical protein
MLEVSDNRVASEIAASGWDMESGDDGAGTGGAARITDLASGSSEESYGGLPSSPGKYSRKACEIWTFSSWKRGIFDKNELDIPFSFCTAEEINFDDEGLRPVLAVDLDYGLYVFSRALDLTRAIRSLEIDFIPHNGG